MALKVIQIEAGGFDNNLSYIIFHPKSKEGIIVDPCGDYDLIETAIRKHTVKILYIVNTHGHHDHIEGNEHFRTTYSAEIITHELARQKADIKVKGDDEIEIGKEKIKIVHTPGHSKDAICLLFGDTLISGDLVFAEGTGRTDLEGSDERQMKRSLGKIFRLPDKTVVYPGHDYGGKKTTVKEIKKELLGY